MFWLRVSNNRGSSALTITENNNQIFQKLLNLKIVYNSQRYLNMTSNIPF